jgi:hypothetical protein
LPFAPTAIVTPGVSCLPYRNTVPAAFHTHPQGRVAALNVELLGRAGDLRGLVALDRGGPENST